jgi:hypothetical protein
MAPSAVSVLVHEKVDIKSIMPKITVIFLIFFSYDPIA